MVDLPIPGGRDVRASLDRAGGGTGVGVPEPDRGTATGACVVACPPHPQHGGRRGDERLRAVSGALGDRGIDCLRFDYGGWDGGRGERADALAALGWAADRYRRVGLFGYSFGGAVALLAAARHGSHGSHSHGSHDSHDSRDRGGLAAVSALAPAAQLAGGDLDAVAALGSVEAPVQVVYGRRDTTADWEPVVERARGLGHAVVALSADHFVVGQAEAVAGRVCGFLGPRLRPGGASGTGAV